MPPKTVIEKSKSPSPDVAVFKISGTLGFHEKDTLEKLFGECSKRHMHRMVLDVAGLTSLGGGCAKIIRNIVSDGTVMVGIAGAKTTVLKFLQKQETAGIVITETVDDAVNSLLAALPADDEGQSDDDLVNEATLDAILSDSPPPKAEVEPAPQSAPEPPPAPKAPEPAPPVPKAQPTPTAPAPGPIAAPAPASPAASATRELKKRIVQYNTLFSINSDFYRIQDRKSLLEVFLLTTIAQVGVESALFLEHSEGYFIPAAMKGLEADEVRGFALSREQLKLDEWEKTKEVYAIDQTLFGDEVKAPLLSLGTSYVAPFIVHGEFRGIVLLGKPIKKEFDTSTIDFLKILINQAAIAYESMARFEEENERTLGLVQTLISLIEENTLARGNTNLITHYVYALAQKVHYAEEHMTDLMYGTVLRDIGMIKVSDLIVRSPRELMPEEWEIIKRHPIDGAEMLENMHFSEHATNVVLSHHERFNGEGYPNGTQGHDIPLGARIVSVVESFAAMLQERPTRPSLTHEEALNTLKENWGMRYDPEVVKGFVDIIEDEIRSGEKLSNKRFELFSV